jgi:hypothetical protein
MSLASDWDWKAHYSRVRSRVAPMAVVRTPVVVKPVVGKSRTIYAQAIGPQQPPPPKRRSPAKATNARPDLARFLYRKSIVIVRRRKGRNCYFYPIGPKAPEVLSAGKKKPKEIIADEIKRSGLTWEQYLAPTRTHRYAAPRRRLYWRLYCETNLSLTRVGALVQRDHTTILHAVRRHEEITKGVAQ